MADKKDDKIPAEDEQGSPRENLENAADGSDEHPDDLALSSGEAPAAPDSASKVFSVIARDGLNLRSGPGTEFPVISSVAFGSKVNLLKRSGTWGLIDLQGDGAADGYVHLSFLQEGGVGPAMHSVGSGFVPLDKTLLQTIMDRCGGIHIRSRLDLNAVADALNRSMLLAEAGTRLREVAFLSQSVIETDYFRTFEEYGKGAGKSYGKYYGRGMHQLTWKDTYAKCSEAVFGDDRLVRNPGLIIDDIEVNVKITAWYWRDYKPFNRLADAGDIDEIIHRLYGGTITSSKPAVRKSVILRRSFYATIKTILSGH